MIEIFKPFQDAIALAELANRNQVVEHPKRVLEKLKYLDESTRNKLIEKYTETKQIPNSHTYDQRIKLIDLLF